MEQTVSIPKRYGKASTSSLNSNKEGVSNSNTSVSSSLNHHHFPYPSSSFSSFQNRANRPSTSPFVPTIITVSKYTTAEDLWDTLPQLPYNDDNPATSLVNSSSSSSSSVSSSLLITTNTSPGGEKFMPPSHPPSTVEHTSSFIPSYNHHHSSSSPILSPDTKYNSTVLSTDNTNNITTTPGNTTLVSESPLSLSSSSPLTPPSSSSSSARVSSSSGIFTISSSALPLSSTVSTIIPSTDHTVNDYPKYSTLSSSSSSRSSSHTTAASNNNNNSIRNYFGTSSSRISSYYPSSVPHPTKKRENDTVTKETDKFVKREKLSSSSTTTTTTVPIETDSSNNNNLASVEPFLSTSSSTGLRQMYIDIGQKIFDTITCPLCHMTYSPGIENKEHTRYCERLKDNYISFPGWKNLEIIVARYNILTGKLVLDNDYHLTHTVGNTKNKSSIARVLHVTPSNSSSTPAHVQKIQEIDNLLVKILGPDSVPGKCGYKDRSSSSSSDDDTDDKNIHSRSRNSSSSSEIISMDNNNNNNNVIHRYLYIQENRVIGIVVVELIQKGYPLQIKSTASSKVLPTSSSLASSSSTTTTTTSGGEVSPVVPIKELLSLLTVSDMYLSKVSQPCQLGIAQIWVHPSYRNQGIAKRLLDNARQRTIYAYEIPLHAVAFSQPTHEGFILASNYLHTVHVPIY